MSNPMRRCAASTCAIVTLVLAAAAVGSLGACSDDETSGSSSTGTAGGGAGGGGGGTTATTTTTSTTSSVAVGGCYDAFDCGVPNDDTSTNGGCVSCAIPDGCPTQAAACAANADCAALRQCVADCGMQSCIDPCVAQHPGGAADYRALLECGYCACSLTSICADDKAAANPPVVCP